MIDQGMGGDIVYISSKNAFFAGPNNVAYGAAKADQAHQVRLLAAELGEHGIRVNGINPDGVVRGSGIFAKGWGAQRAAVYGVPEEELGAFYAQRTLLKREVLPEHVAAAVFALTARRPVADHRAAHPRRRRRRRRVPALIRADVRRRRPRGHQRARRQRPGRRATRSSSTSCDGSRPRRSADRAARLAWDFDALLAEVPPGLVEAAARRRPSRWPSTRGRSTTACSTTTGRRARPGARLPLVAHRRGDGGGVRARRAANASTASPASSSSRSTPPTSSSPPRDTPEYRAAPTAADGARPGEPRSLRQHDERRSPTPARPSCSTSRTPVRGATSWSPSSASAGTCCPSSTNPAPSSARCEGSIPQSTGCEWSPPRATTPRAPWPACRCAPTVAASTSRAARGRSSGARSRPRHDRRGARAPTSPTSWASTARSGCSRT